jgi:hypothetical protein
MISSSPWRWPLMAVKCMRNYCDIIVITEYICAVSWNTLPKYLKLVLWTPWPSWGNVLHDAATALISEATEAKIYILTFNTPVSCLFHQYTVLHKMVKQRFRSTKNLMYLHFMWGQIYLLPWHLSVHMRRNFTLWKLFTKVLHLWNVMIQED